MANDNLNQNLNQPAGINAIPLTKKERRRLKREQKRSSQPASRPGGGGGGRWVWWLVILLVIAAMVYGLYRVATKPSTSSNGGLSLPISADDWQRGGEAAPVALVEYSDFQCPACAFYEPWIQQLAEEFGDDLTVVYRHFPLRQAHLNADWAARASEAAGLQGKFWEMHDLLFEKQEAWAERLDAKTVFIDYAADLALKAEQFKTDLNSKTVKDLVEADYQSGLDSGVKGTPSFFLNGEQIDSPNSYEDFAALIQTMLAEATVANASTTSAVPAAGSGSDNGRQ